MSETYTPQLKLGTVGWESGFEKSALYPEDLPEEWRLTYLSNELDRVAIPLDLLDGVDEAEIEAWVEDTHEQFGFYLYVAEEGALESIEVALELLSPLQAQFLGVLSEQPLGLDCALLEREPLSGALSEEIEYLLLGGEVAIAAPKKELSPMAMRQLIERLYESGVDTLLFVPGVGLIANLANAETIASLLR